MKNSIFKHLRPPAILQRGWRVSLLLILVSLITLTSCSGDDDFVNEPMLKGKISSYNEFGAAMLDFTEAFSSYLLSHGMSQQQIDALVKVLATAN